MLIILRLRYTKFINFDMTFSTFLCRFMEVTDIQSPDIHATNISFIFIIIETLFAQSFKWIEMIFFLHDVNFLLTYPYAILAAHTCSEFKLYLNYKWCDHQKSNATPWTIIGNTYPGNSVGDRSASRAREGAVAVCGSSKSERAGCCSQVFPIFCDYSLN